MSRNVFFEGRERVIKLRKGVAKAEIGKGNKILEKHLGNSDNICTVIDAVSRMGQKIEERKGLQRNEKRKATKNQQGQNRKIQNLKRKLKN